MPAVFACSVSRFLGCQFVAKNLDPAQLIPPQDEPARSMFELHPNPQPKTTLRSQAENCAPKSWIASSVRGCVWNNVTLSCLIHEIVAIQRQWCNLAVSVASKILNQTAHIIWESSNPTTFLILLGFVGLAGTLGIARLKRLKRIQQKSASPRHPMCCPCARFRFRVSRSNQSV